MKKQFAVFDIDGTVGRDSLFHQVIDELINTGKLPSYFRVQIDEKISAYRQRTHIDAYRHYTDFAVEMLFNNLELINLVDYRAAVDAVVERVAKHVYVYTRDLLATLHEQNYFLIALSGSENYAVEQFTKQFKFDIAVGDVYVEKDGKFTGVINHVYGKKDAFIKQFVTDHNLTYQGSIAVGDSLSDSQMLKMVENPIAFNPEDKLYTEAKKQGWKVIIERKNTIYELKKDSKSGQYILV